MKQTLGFLVGVVLASAMLTVWYSIGGWSAAFRSALAVGVLGLLAAWLYKRRHERQQEAPLSNEEKRALRAWMRAHPDAEDMSEETSDEDVA